MAKTAILLGGSVSAPFLLAVTTLSSNFYFAAVAWVLKVFAHASFWGPMVTMIQDTTP